MRACATGLEQLPSGDVRPGPFKGLLFGSSRRFVNDLAMMLRVRAGFLALQAAVGASANVREALGEFVTAVEVWQHQHGYENSMGWAGLDETLRKLNSPEVNAVLDNRFNHVCCRQNFCPVRRPLNALPRKVAPEEESNTA